ncbi:serine/threonine-protein kinase 4-like [Paramacrobiotus metropolitanus]|uniref:serine/threonine-protein kinase 4-like n=1 Tax=Paramacrobiotus metropolitanus TaxID=2943436 RepID=UPI002445FEF1|nr:serine/threonine-protein kinase 4-like [Paramacrobiotus metropolitanus]
MAVKKSEIKRLSEDHLKRKPEDVFDIICKLGEGSYGSVYKAIEKESGMVVAIKQVSLDASLQDIIQEISIMQQCDSPHVVKYYGSYFRDSELLIVMEFCDGGSVSDIMRLRKKTLAEDEIATILRDTLKGLQYLHEIRKIHRDIKAGNILLNTDGNAKLADFGVAGQLTDTMAKRNTVIGTPFWMAPEVIQEIGYDTMADIWSLGITALEMAEGKPPYGDIHPMRAIFMIPSKPPPTFREPDQWSAEFIDFVSKCLVKDPEERATAMDLLEHEFIRNCKPISILTDMIEEAKVIRETDALKKSGKGVFFAEEDQDPGTIVLQDGTLHVMDNNDKTLLVQSQDTQPLHPDNVNNKFSTMIINNDEEDSDATMKRHDTAVVSSDESSYRPMYLDHFDAKDKKNNSNGPASNPEKPVNNPPASSRTYQPIRANAAPRPFMDSDFDFLKLLSYDELHMRMDNLEKEMEQEIEELRQRYQSKRQPILEAIDSKKQRQLNF